ncbi:MAG: hypothetical protein R3C99_15020 [Pirellulaceae bacterium]
MRDSASAKSDRSFIAERRHAFSGVNIFSSRHAQPKLPNNQAVIRLAGRDTYQNGLRRVERDLAELEEAVLLETQPLNSGLNRIDPT